VKQSSETHQESRSVWSRAAPRVGGIGTVPDTKEQDMNAHVSSIRSSALRSVDDALLRGARLWVLLTIRRRRRRPSCSRRYPGERKSSRGSPEPASQTSCCGRSAMTRICDRRPRSCTDAVVGHERSAKLIRSDLARQGQYLRLHHRQPFNPASVIANPKKNIGRPMNTRRMLNISMKPVIQIAEPTLTKMARSKKSGTTTSGRGSWRTRSSVCKSPSSLSMPSTNLLDI
jgi:hypothetical protein